MRPYRGGYLAEERREIEADLFSGRLRAVVATTALELGVDIGGLDACVLNGFPGTVASMWQQAGRAGREGAQSLAVLVAGDDQLDQWLLAHPDELFSRPPEPAVVNLSNPYVLLPHLACAAFEMPLTHDDERWWDDLLADGVRDLVADEQLRIRPRRRSGRRWPTAVWCGDGWPAHGVGLRSGSAGEYRIVTADADGGRRVGGHGGRDPGVQPGPPGRRLPAPGPHLPGGRPRGGRPHRPCRGHGRRRVHPGPVRHRHPHPRDHRPARRRAVPPQSSARSR